eukprot:g24562.t1
MLPINTFWCLDVASHCFPDLEYFTVKCRTYYTPREFTSVILIAVYIPPHADVTNTQDVIHTATSTLETKFPEALFIVAGDFNQANLNTVFLPPAYKQKLKWENLSRKVQCWSEAVEDSLRDCLDLVDWTTFKCSVENLDEYATTVMDFISKCVEDYEMLSLLKARSAAFKSGDPDQRRKSRYDLHKAIREAKGQYQTKLEGQTFQTDSRRLWRGLSDITGYKMKQCKMADNNTSLPDMFNAFYSQFEENTTSVATPAPTVPVLFPLSPLQKSDQSSWESTQGHLVEVFTDTFNLSLLQAKVPTCFKKTTIIPKSKKTHAVCLNDYCPIPLTSIILKCFE